MTGPIIVFVLHNLLLFYLWNQSRKRNDLIGRRNYRFLLLVYIVLAIVGLQSGDYIHHIEEIEYVYNEMRSTSSPSDSMMFFHMEPIYNYLAYWVHGDYIIWRAIVFGIPFIILFFTIKKIELKYWEYYFLFTLISFSGFIVGRMYWGVCLFFCSIACARKTGNKWYLLFAILALFAHKCLYILPAFIPMAYIKLNKKSILIIGGVFVVMTIVLQNLFGYLTIFTDYYEGFSRNLNYYEDGSTENTYSIFGQSIGERIIYLTEFIAMFIATIHLLVKSVQKKISLPEYVQSLLILGFLFIVFAFAFYIVGLGGIYTWRYITISWFPLTFVMCYYIKNRLFDKGIRSIVVSLLLISFEASLTVPIFYAAVKS